MPEKRRGATESTLVTAMGKTTSGIDRLRNAMLKSRSVKVINTLAIRGFGAGLGVLLTLFVTRYIDTNNAATFLLLFNVTTVAAVCFRWGLDDVIVRRLASDATSQASGVTSYLMRLAHRRVAIWAIVSAVAFTCFGFTRLSDTVGLNGPELLTAVVISALIALTACVGRVHQGQGRTNYAAFILNALVPGLLLLGLLVLIGLGIAPTSRQLQAIYLGVSLLAYLGIVWAVSLTRPYWSRSPRERESEKDQAKKDRKAATRLGGVVLSQSGLNWVALLIVPVAYGDYLFTSFMVAYKVAMLINLVQLAVVFTFATRLATFFSAGNFRELQRLTRIMVVSVAVWSGLAAGAVFLSRGFVYSFANVDSRDAILAILVGSQAFFAMSDVYAKVLAMCHEEAFLLRAQGGIATAGVSLFVVLSFTAPLEVASSAFLVTYLAQLIVLRQRGLRVVRGAVTS